MDVVGYDAQLCLCECNRIETQEICECVAGMDCDDDDTGDNTNDNSNGNNVVTCKDGQELYGG